MHKNPLTIVICGSFLSNKPVSKNLWQPRDTPQAPFGATASSFGTTVVHSQFHFPQLRHVVCNLPFFIKTFALDIKAEMCWTLSRPGLSSSSVKEKENNYFLYPIKTSKIIDFSVFILPPVVSTVMSSTKQP